MCHRRSLRQRLFRAGRDGRVGFRIAYGFSILRASEAAVAWSRTELDRSRGPIGVGRALCLAGGGQARPRREDVGRSSARTGLSPGRGRERYHARRLRARCREHRVRLVGALRQGADRGGGSSRGMAWGRPRGNRCGQTSFRRDRRPLDRRSLGHVRTGTTAEREAGSLETRTSLP